MNLLKHIDFGNEAGDDVDSDDLKNFFVEQDRFSEFLDFKKKILLFTGKKGIGKSLLIQWLYLKLQEKEKEAIIIKCRGAELVRNQFNLTHSLENANDHINDWMIRLSALINRKIAQLIKIPFSGDCLGSA